MLRALQLVKARLLTGPGVLAVLHTLEAVLELVVLANCLAGLVLHDSTRVLVGTLLALVQGPLASCCAHTYRGQHSTAHDVVSAQLVRRHKTA